MAHVKNAAKQVAVLRTIEQNIFLAMRIKDKERAKRLAQEIAFRWMHVQHTIKHRPIAVKR